MMINLAEQRAAMLERLHFVEAGGPPMTETFAWFERECRRFRRPGDDFADINVSQPFAGAAIVARWRELIQRERNGPYRERVVARRGAPEDEAEGRLQAAWQRYRTELPALVRALDGCHPRGDYVEWLGLIAADLVMIPAGAHPDDAPEGFTIQIARRIAAARIRFSEASPRKLAEVPAMMAARRARGEAAAREERLAAMEARIAELEAFKEVQRSLRRGTELMREWDREREGDRNGI